MQSTETITITKAEYEQLQAQNLQLMHRLSQLERWVFGRKSERFIPDIPGQPTLFSVLEEPSVVAEVEKEKITYEREKRKKGAEKLHPGRNVSPRPTPCCIEVFGQRYLRKKVEDGKTVHKRRETSDC